MSTELHRYYRPKKLDQVIGQPQAVKTLRGFLKQGRVPQTTLYVGPSGCGKTTLARIMARKLGCGKPDLTEVNAADSRGIDMVRDIRAQMYLSPISGKVKVYIIDEAQKLTGDAQSMLLKMLEEPPGHVYFMLATTDPHKLLNTIRTRCTEIKVALLASKEMESLLTWVLRCEKLDAANYGESLPRVVELAEGSARKALVLLQSIYKLDSEKERLAALSKNEMRAQGIVLARLLLRPGVRWQDVAKVLREMEDEPETVRRIVLGYAKSVILGGSKLADRALFLVDVFSNPFYDTGDAGLVAACYSVTKQK